jgi:hypothetical protein
MTHQERYEQFREKFMDCDRDEKIAMLQEYYENEYPDDEWYNFDDEFFNMFFENKPADAVRSCFFGNIKSWNDDYIRFDGYANLESARAYEVEQEAEEHVDGIFEADCWHDYIELDEEDDEEE